MPRLSPDKRYLLAAGWTIHHEERDGMIKRIYWTDPVDATRLPCYQQLAVTIQLKRDAQAEREAKAPAPGR